MFGLSWIYAAATVVCQVIPTSGMACWRNIVLSDYPRCLHLLPGPCHQLGELRSEPHLQQRHPGSKGGERANRLREGVGAGVGTQSHGLKDTSSDPTLGLVLLLPLHAQCNNAWRNLSLWLLLIFRWLIPLTTSRPTDPSWWFSQVTQEPGRPWRSLRHSSPRTNHLISLVMWFRRKS